MLRGDGNRKGTCGLAESVPLLYLWMKHHRAATWNRCLYIQPIVSFLFFTEFLGSEKVLSIRFFLSLQTIGLTRPHPLEVRRRGQ